jgi:hypothetical protein
MTATFDLNAIANAVEEAANTSPDMNESQGKGGGDYTPPAAGGCIVTLIGYIEKGIHHIEASKVEPLKYPAKDEDQVDLIFEISGKGHEPKEIEGKLYPERMTVTLKKSLNEKAWFYRIFKQFTSAYPELGARHMAQFLGKHFISKIEHSVPKKEGDRIYANLKQKAAGYVFNAPCFTNPATDETTVIPAPRVHSALRLFLWAQASREMWDSLYIEGQYDEKKDEKTGKVIYPAKSKNVIQEKIKAAKNFVGSPLADILGTEELLTLPDTDAAALAGTAPSADAVDDALAGIL